jgi:two-component system nitrate/nitrite response regulator NarL
MVLPARNMITNTGASGPTDPTTTQSLIRVLLIGGANLTRAGLRMLVEARPGLRVLGQGATAEDAMIDAGGQDPDIAILDTEYDIDMDATLAAIREMQHVSMAARILLLATHSDAESGQRAVLAGASGLVLKNQSPDHLLKAIRKVHEGELWVDRATTAVLISGMAKIRVAADPEIAKIASLSRREREVIALIATGLNNKAIAAKLKISDNTVRHHLTSIFDKLEAHDRLELLVYAFRHKLTQVQP